MTTTLTRGKYVLTRADLNGESQLLTDGAVLQTDGVIVEVGQYADLHARHPDAEVIGNGRQFLLPGLVNAHHHGRGLSGLLMGQPDGSLETWIHQGWGRRPVDPYLMGVYTLMQQIRSGTTTVMFNQSAGSTDRARSEAEATLKAFAEARVRVAFSIAFRNQNYLVYGDDDVFMASLPKDLGEGVRGVIDSTIMPFDDYLALTKEFAASYRPQQTDSVRVLLSPQSYHWADEDTLGRIAQAAQSDDLGIHLHMVETPYQRVYAERLHGLTPTRRLDEIGFLGPRVSFAHGVWLTQDDIGLMAETGTSISHNPSSNLRLRSGIAPVMDMHRQGVTVAIGTDSTGINDDDDIFQEMALALRLHRPPGLEEPAITAHQVLHMATLGGAYATTFGQDLIGSLEVGKKADMVLVDWDRVTSVYISEEIDPLEALVARARATDVQTVIIDGVAVYRDGAFTELDEEGITREVAAQLAGPEPDTLQERRRLSRELAPHIRRFYADWDLPTEPLYRYHSIR